ncbi:FAD-binding oxidoreductase, partial [bacterium]|nr:FAD-binding oxidoreductase [bacterium]
LKLPKKNKRQLKKMTPLFDKYARLRKAMGLGSLHTNREKILELLEGQVTRKQLPVLAVEPATVSGIQACLRYASEKKMPVEICSGLSPRHANDLGGKMLLSTAQLVSSPRFRDNNTRLQIAAGTSIESLQPDFLKYHVRWAPLFPPPKATSIGALIASGWEGIRTWHHGGVLSHLAGLEWVDGAGDIHRTGTLSSGGNAADMMAFLYGSRGELGVITQVDLLLEPLPDYRAACVFLLSDAQDTTNVLSQVGLMSPAPDIVLLLDEGSLEILRRQAATLAPEKAKAAVVCEWSTNVPETLPSDLDANIFEGTAEVDELWKLLFSLEPLAKQLFPARLHSQVVLPARAFPDFEAHARELSHEANLPIALWGTVEVGHLHIWLLLPEDEPRLRRRAGEVLDKLQEYSAQLGGGPSGKASGGILQRVALRRGSSPTGWKVRDKLKEQLDPDAIFPAEKALS